MHTDYVSYKNTNYFSDFVCDYLEQKETLKPLYNRFPSLENFIPQVEEKLNNYSAQNREVLVDSITKQYKNLANSKATHYNIALLKQHNTFTVTTGHQLNLFTGPLYFLYKIISTLNLTETLKTNYPEYNFVPVYWMASEDHDFAEINFFNFKHQKIAWSSAQQGAVGRFNTDGLNEVYNIIKTLFGPGKRSEQLQEWFIQGYLKHETLTEATQYITHQLFKNDGLVILDADSADLKRLFKPYIKDELLNQTAYKNVTKTNTYLDKLQLKIQVNPREINLFYMVEGLRERIVFENKRFKVLNTSLSFTTNELLECLEAHPERFSPNVIMRPLYQEVILPNLCYIGGGGELIYWLQLKANFKANNVTFPILLLRNSVLVKSKKQHKKLEKLDLTSEDLFLKSQDLLSKKTQEISGLDIDFSPQIQHLHNQFKALTTLAKQTDKSFIGAVDAQKQKQINGLKHLEKRLLKAEKRRLKETLKRIEDLQNGLFPNQSLQERQVNFSELYLEFGDDLIPKLKDALKPLQHKFTILTL